MRIFSAVLAFALLHTGSVRAGEDAAALLEVPFEKLLDVEIVSASRYIQRSSEIPAATTVVGADQIKGFGYRTLAEILRSVPGMHTTSDRMYDTLGVRGLNGNSDLNGRILVMIDGMRVNDALYDEGAISSEFPLDVDLIERVEVVRGPASSVYGSNAFLAVVNVITKNGRDLQGGRLAASYGGFDTFKGRASYGRKQANGLEYLVSASGLNAQGPDLHYPEFATPQNADGLTSGTNDEHNKQFFAKAGYGDFSLLGGWGRRNRGLPGGIYFSDFDDASAGYQDTYGFVQGQYQTALTPQLDFTGRVWHGDYDYRGVFPYGGTNNVYRSDASWSGFELRLLSGHFEHQHIVGGIEVQQNWSQNLYSYSNATPREVYVDVAKNSHRVGVFVQDDIAITPQLNLTLGARFDDHSLVSQPMFSPKAGLSWQALEDTTFKLLYGESFRSVNAYKQFESYAPSSGTPGKLANPELAPENAQTMQGSWEQRYARVWSTRTTLYYIWLDHLISTAQVAPGFIQTVNGASQAGWGGEFEIERRWDNGALLRASYSQQYAQDRNGQRLVDAPQHLFKVNLLTPLFSPAWHGGVEILGLGPRRSDYGDVAGYALANLTLNWQPHPRLDISAGVYNLLDRRFLSPAVFDGVPGRLGVPTEGRDFRLKLEVAF
ncbi:MAG: hypothetical protein EPN21_16160 [Methylococcaceae bacterium]|nr:MAG: hypothetical protein EPN21_16160 [Methylococcaceae bacterium]